MADRLLIYASDGDPDKSPSAVDWLPNKSVAGCLAYELGDDMRNAQLISRSIQQGGKRNRWFVDLIRKRFYVDVA
jgi:hypothetical protein